MAQSRQILWKPVLSLVLIASLGLLLNACGGKKSMEGAGDEEQVGKVEENSGSPTRLQGEDEGVAQASFDEAEKARRIANLPQGSTKSGKGKLRTVTTKAGDTLWKLAERKDIYGSGWLYPLILKANKDIIKDPSHLEAGLKLKIPRDVGSVEEEIAKEDAMTGQLLDGTPVPSAKATPVVATSSKVKESGHGGHGLLWLLLFLVALLLFLWRRMKKSDEAQPAATA